MNGFRWIIQTMNDDDFNMLKKEFPVKRQYLNKKLAYPYECFICINDFYQKPGKDLNKKLSLVF